jgi:hypothetical protein
VSDTTGVASIDTLVIWSIAISAILGGIALVWRAIRRLARAVDDWIEDWQGTPARPGVPARPGMMERVGGIEQSVDRVERRVGAIEHELHPNSGSSLRDAVDRVEQSICGTDPG